MQAITFDRYGLPSEVLKLSEIQPPTPKGNELLIEVKATTVNDYDWCLVRGKPFLYRLMFGLSKPKSHMLGMELSGVVAEIGPDVQGFQVGDRIYGDTSEVGFGTYAPFICMSEKAFVQMPDQLGYEEAAATPHAGLLAYQGIQNFDFKPEHKVLINGAGGGVGSFAVQLLKKYGCKITGVDTVPKLQHLLNVGYDEVIDYKTTNFTKQIDEYDFVLDCKSNHSFFAYRKCLKKGGKFVTVGGKLTVLMKLLFWSKVLPKRKGKTISILALKANVGLKELEKEYLNGALQPAIDGPHPLTEAAIHIQRFGDGLHTGKIILTP